MAKLMGKPKLDYYIGRLVTDVQVHEEGWDIVLDGGILITNLDGRRSAPESLIGLSFVRPILSDIETRIQFGTVRPGREIANAVEVVLTPTQYRISDDRYEGGPHLPGVDVEVAVVPLEDADRTAEGPSLDFLAIQMEEDQTLGVEIKEDGAVVIDPTVDDEDTP